MYEPLIDIQNIYKEFPGVKALKGVNFSLEKGSIVSLVGTNGAGKSTLSNVIAGICEPDAGEVCIAGEKVKIANPKVAELLGIGMVHQEPSLVPDMTVVQNIFLNKEITKFGFFLDFKTMKYESQEVLKRLGFHIDLDRKAESLSLVEKEVVEIAKAMLLKPKILILDEVTAPLGQHEVDNLFKILYQLKDQGIGIIYISHKIKEILQISDKVVVFRDGENVGELNVAENLSEKEIIALMLGEIIDVDLDTLFEKETDMNKEEVLLETINLTKKGFYQGINFSLLSGEIVGFAGLKGAGITELFKSIQGITMHDRGEVRVKGSCVRFKTPRDGIKYGIGMITNDRQREGLAITLDVKENMTISSLEYLTNKLNIIDGKKLKLRAEDFIRSLEVKTPSLNQLVQNLSGGNQQKIVVAKWLMRDLDIIIVDEPTRGVDVKAKSEIYKLLIEQKNNKKGLIVSSPELRELLDVCDRILVVVSGKIVSEVKRNTKQFNEKEILEIMHTAGN